jgi:predicted membrane channel-forming protein YqfA (hemolysin III family)
MIVYGIYGGLFLIVITLMIGVAAVPFRSKCSPESVSRHAAFLSFLMLAALGTVVICTLISSWELRIVPIVVGALSATTLVILWHFSGKHYR